MKGIRCKCLFLCLPGILFLVPCPMAGQQVLAPSPIVSTVKFNWQTVVNNGFYVPNDTLSRNFNSYNEPSINVNQLVVFRGRSRGGTGGGCGEAGLLGTDGGSGCGEGEAGGGPAHGIFKRNMALRDSSVMPVFDRNTRVPQPNYPGTKFNEPPSFPRIDMFTDTIASRGNHQPVWTYEGNTAGTTGIYTNPFGLLIAGASNLGVVPDFSFFAVPDKGIKFDVFPGAPSVTDGNTIVFKGNYSVTGSNGERVSKTGAYFRTLMNAPIELSDGKELEPAAGNSPVMVLADPDTLIPHTRTNFGSLGPPSAAGSWAVFAGFDNEDNPTAGGIYLAPLQGRNLRLRSVAEIGGAVPGEKKGTVFNKLGESISFDGRFVAFWGAWGAETKAVTLHCPTEGNKVRNAYCLGKYPENPENPEAGGFGTAVPVHQGIFVYDTVAEQTAVVAKSSGGFDDFVFWKFSGYVPGMGMGESEDSSEPARWRSSSFVAVSGLADGDLNDGTFHVAFKARTGLIDGIYLYAGPGSGLTATVVQTGKPETLIDSQAKDDATGEPLPITRLGMERDGFRGRSLVINVRMGAEETGWAGIYMTEVPNEMMKE